MQPEPKKVIPQVLIYNYSLHMPSDTAAEKLGGIVLRLAAHGQDLLTWLMRTKEILKVTSAILTDIVANNKIRTPKNSSKNAKIRKLMALQSMKTNLTEQELNKLEAQMKEQENRRNKKRPDEDKDDDASENEETLV